MNPICFYCGKPGTPTSFFARPDAPADQATARGFVCKRCNRFITSEPTLFGAAWLEATRRLSPRRPQELPASSQ